jgi:hypothetical protein
VPAALGEPAQAGPVGTDDVDLPPVLLLDERVAVERD